MAKWGIWFFVIGRRTLTPDLGENGVKTLVCVCVYENMGRDAGQLHAMLLLSLGS
jgi:hypothetical protein